MLRRPIPGRADQDAGLGELDRGRDLEVLGQPEVGQDHARALRQHHVVGLQVAVEEPRRVNDLERGAELASDLQRVVLVEGPVANPLGQGLALDPSHGQPRHPLLLASVDDLNQVGVREALQGRDLTAKASPLTGVRAGARAQDLDRELGPADGIASRVDRPHAPLTQESLQLVSTDSLAHDRSLAPGRTAGERAPPDTTRAASVSISQPGHPEPSGPPRCRAPPRRSRASRPKLRSATQVESA